MNCRGKPNSMTRMLPNRSMGAQQTPAFQQFVTACPGITRGMGTNVAQSLASPEGVRASMLAGHGPDTVY